ncbi:MAG: hypothetical protein A2Y12_16905 [Planctomycetes bacterium GWF2_42_9]|nr:MAG: hypothetical protein A2Y12_16905 [Planctomycetes bacterium GWF2_42_9]
MSLQRILKYVLLCVMCESIVYGGIFPELSSFDLAGLYSGWSVSGNVNKITSPVYGGTGQAVKITGGSGGWFYKSYGTTANINAVTIWCYEPSANRTNYSGENRSVNIMLQRDGFTTGPYLTFLTYNNLRYLTCFQNSVATYITPVAENQYFQIKLELLGDVSNQKYVIYYNGTKFDNSGQGYGFQSSCSKLDKVMFSNTNTNSNVYAFVDQVSVDGSGGPTGLPVWSFEDPLDPDDDWQNYDSAILSRSSGKLNVSIASGKTFGIIAAQVNPFDSNSTSILRLDVNCPGEDSVTLYWKNSEMISFMGIPIPLKNGRSDPSEGIDLRTEETWTGTITDIGIGIGTYGDEQLSIDSLGFYYNTAGVPVVRATYVGFKDAINRPNRAATISITLKHISGPAIPSSLMTFTSDSNYFSPIASVTVPAINPGQNVTVETQVLPLADGQSVLECHYNGQKFIENLRIDEPTSKITPGSYAVPVPVPINTNYNIGTFYFPGWSNECNYWQSYDYLGLEPVIGKYLEGQPEVSDWQIKFAVENGVNFFIFDWYWQNGTERLGAALRDGFMRARYKNMMKFCLLLCNHEPFAGSTDAELTQITDFWINNYLKQSNYLRIDEKPCIIFWSLYSLRMGLGNGTPASASTVAATLNSMRQRCIDAGLPGLYIGLCMQSENSSSVMSLYKECGFDFVTEYAFANTGQVTDHSPYHEFVLKHREKWDNVEQTRVGLDLDYMPTLTPTYDRRPWKGPMGLRRFEHSSVYWGEALSLLKTHMDTYGQTFCILGNWNEYGEGCVLEPTNKVGFGDLEAVRQTFATPGNWPVNIVPSDLEWPYLQPFVKKDVSILNYGFETDVAVPAFTSAYDNDPCSPPWTVQESTIINQVQVFGNETAGVLPQWIYGDMHALSFKIISDPMSFRPSVYTSLMNKTAVRWNFRIYVPSNVAIQSETRSFDFSIKGIKTSDHATEDRATLATLFYTSSNTAQIKIYSPLHSGWQTPIEISTDQYHLVEIEARTLPDGDAWFIRIDGQVYDNDGDGWSLFNAVDYFTKAEIRGGEIAGVQIFMDNFSTSWIPQYWFGDINKDNFTNFEDLGLLAANWLISSCSSDNQWCDGADCDQNGKIDFADLAMLAPNWLN